MNIFKKIFNMLTSLDGADCNDADYLAMVDRFLRQDANEIFGSFSRDNANKIILKFIEKSMHSFIATSNNEPESFFNDFTTLEAMRVMALRINVECGVKIITTNGVRNQLLTTLEDRIVAETGKHLLQYLPGRYTGSKAINNFVVSDDKRYHIQSIHPNVDPSVIKAEVCCNGVKKARDLSECFYTGWSVMMKNSVIALMKGK